LTFAERVSGLSLNGGFGANVVDFSQQLLSTSYSWGALVPAQSVAGTESDEELKSGHAEHEELEEPHNN
jgi:hypothetical protein